jgi:hypothetical protein
MLTKRQTQDKRLNILTEETYLKKMSIKSPLAKRQTGDLVSQPKAEKKGSVGSKSVFAMETLPQRLWK